MNIVNPGAELITEENPLKRIELCGRVCYKSEEKIGDGTAEKFVRMLIKRGHTSVLEHARVSVHASDFVSLLNECKHKPFGLDSRLRWEKMRMFVNARDYIALGGSVEELGKLPLATDFLTARFLCDRGVANELVRHRVFSFSQESTRYVNYRDGLTVVRPLPFDWAENKASETFRSWYWFMEAAEERYGDMIRGGATPQEARSVLPLSTKTELVMTGTMSQWKEMLQLRLAKAAHPQMRYLMELFAEKAGFGKR